MPGNGLEGSAFSSAIAGAERRTFLTDDLKEAVFHL
jgi:hypothetical protein